MSKWYKTYLLGDTIETRIRLWVRFNNRVVMPSQVKPVEKVKNEILRGVK